MSNYALTASKIKELIEASASLDPSLLVPSGLLTELEEVAKSVEPFDCDDIAEIFLEMCKSRDENDEEKIDTFQQVLILSIVEKMNWPDPEGAEGFHHGADKCSCELIDLGGYFFEQDDADELKLALDLISQEKISEFAQTTMIQGLYELDDSQMKALLLTILHPLVWCGAFSNDNFATVENIVWLIENIPNFEADDLISMIEESHITNAAWQYPFLQFSREDEPSENLIIFIVSILENGFEFRNKNEEYLANKLIEWEDEHGISLNKLVRRVVDLSRRDGEVLRMAQNSLLPAFSDAVDG